MKYGVVSLCCGLGGHALGLLRARSEAGSRFESVGAFDLDEAACRDFKLLTGAEATPLDLAVAQPADLASRCTRRPDVVIMSAPCQGFSGCLPESRAAEPHYQDLNAIALRCIDLALEAWPVPPALILFENVPRITARGRELLKRIIALLRGKGYLIDSHTHDCGEIGGLAQRRQRFLLVARHPTLAPHQLMRPPAQPLRAMADVLWPLPVPTPTNKDGGRMHRLPKLAPINWLRLAAIRAGRDWRDLPEAIALPTRKGRQNGGFGVNDSTGPAHAVLADADVRNAWASSTDPRLGHACRRGSFEVQDPRSAARTVIGVSGHDKSGRHVADPRLPARASRHAGIYGVLDPSQPARTVIREARSGKAWCETADGRPGYAVTHQLLAHGALDASRDAWTAGRFELAGPELDLTSKRPTWVLIAAPDGTVHRPLTTLELAVLQGLPAWHKPGDPAELELGADGGSWLELEGAQEGQRARIGNAIPPPAAQAIGVEILEALDAAKTGAYRLFTGGLWVAPHLAA